jgi:glucose/arabinose dehydrogenase
MLRTVTSPPEQRPSRRDPAALRAVRSACIVAMLGSAAGPAVAQQVPTGFAIQPVVGVPFAPQVSAFAFLPDGRVVVLEKDSGGVRLAAVGAGTSVLIATIADVSVAAERGLLGVAVDPGWPARPYLYFLFTHTGATLHLVLYTATGDLTAPASTDLQIGTPFVLLDDLPDLFENHNGGTLRFGPDGFLYVSLGDDSQSCQAQDVSAHLGKLLRLDVSAMPQPGPGPPPKSALVAAGNPYTESPNARLVYATGLRNPFRFSIDPLTNDVFIGDVGLETWEEIDALAGATAAGSNYGWPEFEGPLQDPDPNAADCADGAFVPPIYVYPNPPGGNVASVVCGPLYRTQAQAPFAFPRAYDGDLFICEFYARWIRRLVRGPGGWALAGPVPGQPSATEWATNLGNIADLQVGPDGALYFLVMFNGGFLSRGLYRIVNTLPSDVTAEDAVGLDATRLVARPNPARAATGSRLWLRFPAPGAATAAGAPRRARILDVAGRVVRELPVVPQAAAGPLLWTATWNGRTSLDVHAAPGTYFVEIRGDRGPVARTKLTLVR